MALSNPVNPTNIVDHFRAVVNAFANSGIVWGTNNFPFSQFPASFLGGTTAGKTFPPESDSGADFGVPGGPITAAPIYNFFVGETNRYTSIRLCRARLNIRGTGGNTGSYPTTGIIFDQTNVTHMSNQFLQSIGTPNNGGVEQGNEITELSINTFFENLKSAYTTVRNNTVGSTVTVTVCHSSCHSSCHGSRGRR